MTKKTGQIKNETQQLIDSLSEGLEPVKCMKHPCRKLMLWVLFVCLYAGVVIFFIGLRGDFVSKLHDPVFLLEIGVAFAMSLAGAMSSHWLCVPDMRGQSWMLVVALTLFTVLIGWLMLQVSFDLDYVDHMYFSHCMTDGIVYGLIPAGAIVFLSMRGKTTRPALMILMNIISACGLGYIGLRLTCSCDDIWHILIHHVSPYLLLAIVVSVIGQKLYRW